MLKKSNADVFASMAESIALKNNIADTVFASYSFRNMENRKDFLLEAKRILKGDGVVIILELATPPLKLFYTIYMCLFVMPVSLILFKSLKPFIYLYKTINEFSRVDIKKEIVECGYNVIVKNLFPYTSKLYILKKC